MKLSNLKFSPFLACILGLSFPNAAYCAPKKGVRTTAAKKSENKPTVLKKEIVEKEEKAPKTIGDEKNEVKEEKKEDVKPVVEEKKEKSPIAEVKVDEKKVEIEKNEDDEKKVENRGRKEGRNENLKKEDKKEEIVEEEEKKVDEKKKENKGRSRRRKRGRDEKSKDVAIEGSWKSKRKKFNEEVKKEKDVDVKEKIVEEEENFQGISREEYFSKLSDYLGNYSGKNVQEINVEKMLSGKNLDCFKNTYKIYDKNGNPKFKKNDIQFKNQLIRRIDLREKVNLPFFRSNKEITKYLLDGIAEGKLVAYSDVFLTQKLTSATLKEQLLMPKDVETATSGDEENEQELFFDAHDVSSLEIISNWIFDKNTSDFSEDPTIIKLIIPAEKFSDTTKIQRVVCCVRYSDALNFLKNFPEASWIDDDNEAVALPIGEAFSMRLYDSNIIFLGNRDCNNGDVADRWGTKENDPSFAGRKAEEFKYKFEGSLDSI